MFYLKNVFSLTQILLHIEIGVGMNRFVVPYKGTTCIYYCTVC